jgi:hypothetical protein
VTSRFFSLAILGQAIAVLGAIAPAQELRLVEHIESPLLYLSMEPGAGEPGAGQATAVQRLLGDPALDDLLGFGDLAASENSVATAFGLLRGVLRRAEGELEIALVGIMPANVAGSNRPGQPLLACRVRLGGDEAGRMRQLLANSEIARAHRAIAGQPTYVLTGSIPRAGAGRSTGKGTDAGALVEVAVVGNDLVVTNYDLGMTTLLQATQPPVQKTSAAPFATRRALAQNPQFQMLRGRLEPKPGTLIVYGDWARLGPRLESLAAGLPGLLFEWSGATAASAVMMALAPGDQVLKATLLLDCSGGFGAIGGLVGPDPGREPMAGWLAAVQPVPARSLIAELPVGGLGGLVLAIDPLRLARTEPGREPGRSEPGHHRGPPHRGRPRGRHGHFVQLIEDGLREFGLDYERNVLAKLGSRGSLQLLFGRSDGEAPPEVRLCWSLQAKNRSAAAELFRDLARSSTQAGVGTLVPAVPLPGGERRPAELLFVDPVTNDQLRVGVIEGSIVISEHASAVAQMQDEARAAAKNRGRRDAAVTAALQAIGSEKVAGLFDLDLSPWIERAGAALASATGRQPNLDGIPTRHIGCLDVQPGGRNTVLRLQVLSSR